VRLKELETKWNTGETDDVPFVIDNIPGKPRIFMPQERHVAPLGDFIGVYIKHLTLPWWKKDHYWDLTEKQMRDKLNQASITWHR